MRASLSFVRIIKVQTVAINNKTTALIVTLFQEASTFFTASVFILGGMSFKGAAWGFDSLKKNKKNKTALQ